MLENEWPEERDDVRITKEHEERSGGAVEDTAQHNGTCDLWSDIRSAQATGSDYARGCLLHVCYTLSRIQQQLAQKHKHACWRMATRTGLSSGMNRPYYTFPKQHSKGSDKKGLLQFIFLYCTVDPITYLTLTNNSWSNLGFLPVTFNRLIHSRKEGTVKTLMKASKHMLWAYKRASFFMLWMIMNQRWSIVKFNISYFLIKH